MIIPVLALLLAAPARIAVLPVAAGEGVTDKTAAAVTEALAAEVRKRSGSEVITQREINTVLSLERQKAMMGCATDACMAELGGALGVTWLVNGDIARVGESLLVHVRLVEVTRVRVAAQADRRFRKGTLDDVLDGLPAMAGELFPDSGGGGSTVANAGGGDRPRPAPDAGGEAVGTAPGPKPAADAKPLPPPWAEEPEKVPAHLAETLALWEDGSGNYFAMNTGALDETIFAGTAKKLFRQRSGGGYLNAAEGKGDRSFWDPRTGGVRGMFSFSPEGATLACGKASFPYKRVPALEAKKVLTRAELLAPRWRRIPVLLARDDQGMYFYVDAARQADGEQADPADYRLYVGKKGALARVNLDDAIRDSGGYLFITSAGRLVARQQGQKFGVEWGAGNTRLALTWLDPADHGLLIYKELGVYAGQQLGTPCDGRL